MTGGDVSKVRADKPQATKEELEASLRRQQHLLTELQHRERNSLAVIRSIVRRSAESSDSVEEFANHLDGRIGAISRVQLAVARDPLIGFDLAELISEEFRICAVHEGEQYTLNGPSIRLKPKAAESIGLAVHELATNAVKYGAFTVSDGRIDVRWSTASRGDQTWLSLDWKESGLQGRPVEERRRGFGTVLLQETLQYDLGAVVERMFEPTGFHCGIAFPLGRHAAS